MVSPTAEKLNKASAGVRRLADAIPLGGGEFDDCVTREARQHAVADASAPRNTRWSAAPKGVLVKLEGVNVGLPQPAGVAESKPTPTFTIPKKKWDKSTSAWVDLDDPRAESSKAASLVADGEGVPTPRWDKTKSAWSNAPKATREHMSLPLDSISSSEASGDATAAQRWDKKNSCWVDSIGEVNRSSGEVDKAANPTRRGEDPKKAAKSRLSISISETEDTVDKILSPTNLGKYERSPAKRRISAPHPHNAKVLYVTDAAGKASVADSIPLGRPAPASGDASSAATSLVSSAPAPPPPAAALTK